jgi:hypothetical protein
MTWCRNVRTCRGVLHDAGEHAIHTDDTAVRRAGPRRSGLCRSGRITHGVRRDHGRLPPSRPPAPTVAPPARPGSEPGGTPTVPARSHLSRSHPMRHHSGAHRGAAAFPSATPPDEQRRSQAGDATDHGEPRSVTTVDGDCRDPDPGGTTSQARPRVSWRNAHGGSLLPARGHGRASYGIRSTAEKQQSGRNSDRHHRLLPERSGPTAAARAGHGTGKGDGPRRPRTMWKPA